MQVAISKKSDVVETIDMVLKNINTGSVFFGYSSTM